MKLPKELTAQWDQLKEPVVIHSQQRALYATDAFAEILNYSRPEYIKGLPMGELLSPWPEGMPRLGQREVIGRQQDGGTRDLRIISLPCVVHDDLLFQTVVRDITELKSWEEKLLQAERLTAMGQLAGEIAHEINNPLGGILLYGNLIKEDLKKGSQAFKNLEKIIKLATRCRIIAKGLLNFGKASSGKFVPVDINQVIKDMYSLIEDHKILKQVRVKFRLGQNIPHLMGDRGQMEQAVLNLIINAGEAMEGKGRLVISTSFWNDKSEVMIEVEDTGPGIEPDELNRIFEPFYTKKKKGKGTGLGLSITHGIVQRHGGKITVESQVNKGTKFKIIFPVQGRI